MTKNNYISNYKEVGVKAMEFPVLTDRPTPLYDALKSRPLLILDQPLVGMLQGQILPTKGTGLITGRAGERRGGKPRTFIERLKRHRG